MTDKARNQQRQDFFSVKLMLDIEAGAVGAAERIPWGFRLRVVE